MNADKLTPDALQTLMQHKDYQTHAAVHQHGPPVESGGCKPLCTDS
jgi:hypothetical protein